MSDHNDAPALPAVLFVCVKNGGKSQMAAALFRRLAGDRVEVHSAGTQPGDSVNAMSAAAVGEVGASMQGKTPKPIDPKLLRRVDRTIVLGTEAKVERYQGCGGHRGLGDG